MLRRHTAVQPASRPERRFRHNRCTAPDPMRAADSAPSEEIAGGLLERAHAR